MKTKEQRFEEHKERARYLFEMIEENNRLAAICYARMEEIGKYDNVMIIVIGITITSAFLFGIVAIIKII